MRHDAAESLVAANKRIGNILRKAGAETDNEINEDLLEIEEEKCLFEEIRNISADLEKLYGSADYTAALTMLAGLSGEIEAFFDKVMVMDDDAGLRRNRLNLLARLKALFDRTANLALLG